MPATAAGLTAFMPPLSSFEVAQNPFEGVDHRLPPHAFPVAGEVPGLAAHRPRARPREANHSDRLLRCAAAGSRDAGHRQCDRAFAVRERTLRHLARGRLADRAMLRERLLAD